MLVCSLILATQVYFSMLVAEMLASENNIQVCVFGFFYSYSLNLCAYVKSQLGPEAKFIIAHKAMCYILIS